MLLTMDVMLLGTPKPPPPRAPLFALLFVAFGRVVKDAGSLGAPPTKGQGMEGGELSRRWAEVAEHRSNLREKWSARLQWVPEDVDVWRGILAVRSLVLKPREASCSSSFSPD